MVLQMARIKAAGPQSIRTKPVFAFPYLGDEERRAQVWELRLRGYSHEAISRELIERFGEGMLPVGYSPKHVYDDCTFVLNAIQNEFKESSIEMVGIEVKRFDKMLEAIWDKAEAGDVSAIDRVLAISKERRKMLGLDTPEKFAIDWRMQVVTLLESGTVTPQQIATEFGNDALIAINQLLIEKAENGA
jgi:hypothetical protein